MVPQPLVLASASPQRRAILTQLGVEFVVRAADVEELTEGEPVQMARDNARLKAEAVPGERVLGVDTVVRCGQETLGKPPDARSAAVMLRRLQGRTHRVISGAALRSGGVTRVEHAVTTVTFRSLGAAEIDDYVAVGEWEGRAGGYAIQGRGAWLIEGIAGDYLNVVGLPVQALLRLLSAG